MVCLNLCLPKDHETIFFIFVEHCRLRRTKKFFDLAIVHRLVHTSILVIMNANLYHHKQVLGNQAAHCINGATKPIIRSAIRAS